MSPRAVVVGRAGQVPLGQRAGAGEELRRGAPVVPPRPARRPSGVVRRVTRQVEVEVAGSGRCRRATPDRDRSRRGGAGRTERWKRVGARPRRRVGGGFGSCGRSALGTGSGCGAGRLPGAEWTGEAVIVGCASSRRGLSPSSWPRSRRGAPGPAVLRAPADRWIGPAGAIDRTDPGERGTGGRCRRWRVWFRAWRREASGGDGRERGPRRAPFPAAGSVPTGARPVLPSRCGSGM